MATKKKEEVNMGLYTLKNVSLFYSRINEPTLLKNAKDANVSINPDKPHLNTEYVFKALVPESTLKLIKKRYPKCSNAPHAVEYTQEDFAEAFYDGNVDLIPDVGQKEDEDLVLMKFAQKAFIGKIDKETSRCSESASVARKPTVIGIKGRVQDVNGEPIDDTIIIGNGTIAHIQLRPVDFGANGIYLYPNAICIKELVKYEQITEDFSEFDIEELDDLGEDNMDGEGEVDGDFYSDDDFA